MGDNDLKTYHFETADQWSSCLFSRTERGPENGVGPFNPFSRVPERFESAGARVLVVTHAGEVLWVDDADRLHRIPDGCDIDAKAPNALLCASRLAATRDGIWTLWKDPKYDKAKKPRKVQRQKIELFEAGSFARLLELEFPALNFVDLASDGRATIFALAEENGAWKAISFDPAGRISGEIAFEELSDAVAFTYLRNSREFVVLTGGSQPKLIWFGTGETGAQANDKRPDCKLRTRAAKRAAVRIVAGMRPCFTATLLGSDSKERVFLAGNDGPEFGGAEYILTFDADGNSLDEIPIDRADSPLTGLAASRGSLLASGSRGLLKFVPSKVMPQGSAPNRASLITPVLFSPDRADGRRWLRIKAAADLPEGTTLEISYASADKDEDRDRLLQIANDASISASRRVETLLGQRDTWKGRTVFRGSGSGGAKEFSAKLFNEKDRYLWVSVSLTTASGAPVPSLSSLDVFYPGRTLMEYLPAIYQKQEEKPDSFLRSLVGVLETTTRDIDERIASLSSLINPERAPVEWLDFVARWLGLPWDDDLGPAQKRCLLTNAEKIIEGRGTRSGLETFLACIMPGTPRRFRITDPTADSGFAVVGGGKCAGSALPAILGGHAPWSTELGINSVLGKMRLKCEDRDDDGLGGLAGKLWIDIAATADERKAWEPWLLTLVSGMVPLAARVELRWVPGGALESGNLDGTMVLKGRLVARLDNDAIMGLALLPETGISLSDMGSIIGRRLK